MKEMISELNKVLEVLEQHNIHTNKIKDIDMKWDNVLGVNGKAFPRIIINFFKK